MLAFLEELEEKNISVFLNGDNLELNFDSEIEEEVLHKIKQNKEQLVSFLKKYDNISIVEEIEPIPFEENYKISNAQRRLWLLNQIDGGSEAYHIPSSIIINIDNLELFKKAIYKVFERHEILRTVFKENKDGEIRQWVKSTDDFEIEIKIENYDESDTKINNIQRRIDEDIYKPFDFENGPLIRLILFPLEENKYVFYYNMHHIISDGWSMNVLNTDVLAYYNAYLTNQEVSLPELRIQYKDYTYWQIEKLASEEYKKHQAFWLDKLSGELPVLDLPSNKLRPEKFSFTGHSLKTSLSPELTTALKTYCADHNGSLFMGLVSVFNLILNKYTGQKDIIIGSPVTGRDHPDLEDQIGFYVNTLVLRNTINPEDSFDTFFSSVKENIFACYNHQMYPFDEQVEALALKRDYSRNIIFDVMLTLQNTEEVEKREVLAAEEYLKIHDNGACAAQFDLEIDIQDFDSFLEFQITFYTGVYEKEMIERLIRHFKELLHSIFCNTTEKIKNLEYLSSKERQTILIDFNDTYCDYSSKGSFLECFKKHLDAFPEKIAVKATSNKLTYKDLDVLSDKFAQHLQSCFASEKGDQIILNIERNEWLVVSILAIFKLGGAYIPVDPSYPEERKKYILENSNYKAVISSDVLAEFISKKDTYSDTFTAVATNDEDLAYIIYTSGSTGNPKGVMIPHRGMLNHLYAMEEELELNTDSIIVQNAPYTFDISVWQLLNALIVGGTTSIYEQDTVLDLGEFLNRIKQEKATILQVVPTYLKELLDYETSKGTNYLGELTYISSTGEAISKKLIDRWFSVYANIPLVNAYGPAEGSDDTTLNILVEPPAGSKISVGKPMQNISIYILDEYLKICGLGIAGEICISGVGLAKGYLNNEELTREKFIPHPFKSGEYLYKTGDLGEWQADGSIIFLGRKDHQVKIRGHRIELGEIENQLLINEAVESVVVMAIDGNSGQKELVANVVLKDDIDVDELRSYLSQKVPAFMVPNYFIALEAMPLNPNGKIDRKALAAYNLLNKKANTVYIAGRTEEEKVLLSVCENVLKRDKISIKENYFNLGGDSIKSIQIISRLNQKGYRLRVREVMSTPILEDLAKRIQKNTKEISQSVVEGSVLLTPIQQGLFSATEIQNPTHYNQSVCLKAKTAINGNLLNQCIAELVKHHDALRMTYTKEGDAWQQFNRGIGDDCFSIDFYDLRGDTSAKKTMQEQGQLLQSSIDLENGPLFKIGHFRRDDGDYLALIIHHLVIDGISWRILLEDLSNLYNQASQKQSFQLPLKTESFQLWASMLSKHVSEEQFLIEKSYWEDVCKQTIEDLPTDMVIEDSRILSEELSITLPKETTKLLQSDIHAAYNTEINDILLTALGLALKESFGVDKAILNMEGHGREEIVEDVDITRTVGWFTSEFPFVLDVQGEDVIHNLIHVKESLRKIPNKGIGYGMFKYLTDDFNTDVKPSVEFNYLGDFGQSLNSDSSEEETPLFDYVSENIGLDSDAKNGSVKKLDVVGALLNEELQIAFSYSKKEYKTETIQQLAVNYINCLERLIKLLSDVKVSYLTPSDVTYNLLSVEELFEVNKNLDIEDIYKLSPLQEGIYYHWLADTSSSLYLEQMSYSLEGIELDKESIEKAYNQLIERHGILRTSFSDQYGGDILQFVYKKAFNNFSYERIEKKFNATEKAAFIESVKEEDRAHKFDVSVPCLMRLKILDFGDGSYEFLWSHHHILMDGWCMGIIVNEFTELFEAILQERTPVLDAVTPYSNYIKWLASINKQSSLDYWKSYLEEYYQTASIPFKNRNIDDNVAFNAGTSEFTVSGNTFKKIEKICVDAGVTMNTFMQATWGYLLGRYNNVNDVVYGVVVSGRPPYLEGVENILGLFINTVPVRMTYTEDDTPISILQKMHTRDIDGEPHHYLSLAEIQSESNLGMDLLDHILVFENYPIQEIINEEREHNVQEEQLAITSIDMVEQTNYDLDVTIGLSHNKLTVELTYDTNVYQTTAMETMATHFQNVINRFATQETKTLTDFEILSETERNELLITNNDYNITYPTDQTILDVFTERVLENPNEIAVVFQDTKLTFKELDEVSTQLANYLIQNHAITKGSLIGFKLERSEWVIVSIFAILKTGSAYIPVDPSYPKDRIEFIENDSQFELCIDQEIVENFKKHQPTISTERPTVLKTPNDLAYIIYTSGSTGYPKGVLVTHASVVNIYYGWKTAYNLEDFKVTLLQLASFSFDMSVADLCRSILTGGTMVICGNDRKLDTVSMCNLIKDNQVSVFEGTPSFVIPLMRHIHKEKVNVESLKMIILGGESLDLKDFEFLMLEFGNSTRVINSYGVTEATVDSTYYECEVDANHDFVASTPIGIPFPNVKLYALDSEMRLAPKGVMGELYIGGKGVANGYLNRPELSEEKFIANPFEKGAFLYKSGDMVKWLSNGALEFCGRQDDQVKIRGFRIELGEIENSLKQIDFINDAKVLITTDELGEKKLVAYLIAKREVNINELRSHLLEKIPAYMLPESYVTVDAFPLTVNGKINKRKLLAIGGDNVFSANKYIAPRNEVEEKLVDIWADVLKVDADKIGVNANFIELGGHSLKVIRVIAKIQKELEVKIDIQQFFEAPILESIAAIISNVISDNFEEDDEFESFRI
ncbi:amino acid adenylation domain-containing protein [Kordia sp. TARA_039_SRF]|nr:amino acid adenylation domain-containing protein [Kordia sp. TARA_039_SRF]